METITELVKNRIDLLLQSQDRVIVAIDGCCTSGKTTLAGKLEAKGRIPYDVAFN